MSVPPNKSIISKPKYPIPLKSTSGFPKYCLEGEVKEKFFELYPTHTHPELMQLFGVSYSTIARFAKQYGLQKNIEVIKSKRIRLSRKLAPRMATMPRCAVVVRAKHRSKLPNAFVPQDFLP